MIWIIIAIPAIAISAFVSAMITALVTLCYKASPGSSSARTLAMALFGLSTPLWFVPLLFAIGALLHGAGLQSDRLPDVIAVWFAGGIWSIALLWLTGSPLVGLTALTSFAAFGGFLLLGLPGGMLGFCLVLVSLGAVMARWTLQRVSAADLVTPGCRHCGYDLRGLPSGVDRCPECGRRL